MNKIHTSLWPTSFLLFILITCQTVFAVPKGNLVIDVIGSGLVESTPDGILCSTSCEATFDRRINVTLVATPTNQQMFIGWSGACTGTDPVCVFQMQKEVSAVAAFAPKQSLPVTGQTTCWDTAPDTSLPPIPCEGTGQDGDIQAGAAFSYTDNGDGTITDNNTQLIWEKKDDNNISGIHDKDNVYTFDEAFSVFIDALNNTCNGEGITVCAADNECGAGEVCGFAGHQDWLVPNVRELQSIVNYEAGTSPPAVSPEFSSTCVAGCTLTECSCTANDRYWSSTTFASNLEAFIVNFQQGIVLGISKNREERVRAVRNAR